MINLTKRKKNRNVDAYRSYIPSWSALIGKAVKEIMAKYDGKITIMNHHNLLIPDNTIFCEGMDIKILGDWENICDFTREYNLP